MGQLLPRDVLFAAGGDVLAKYQTLVKRNWPADRHGEDLRETYSRAGLATSVAYISPGVLGVLNYGANMSRVEWAPDPVTALVQQYLLLEPAATNVVLQNRDLTNAAWTKTSCTPAKDQIGVDGTANGASSLVATAGNATCLQAITLASSQRFQTAYVKRLIGSGEVDMTTDGGTTWTNITSGLSATLWTRISIPAQTLANPSVGFRLVTNGDKIAVDFVQNETGSFQTSVIATTTAAVTRNVDAFSVPFYVAPQTMAPAWAYTRWLERGGQAGSPGNSFLWQIGNAFQNGRLILDEGSNFVTAYHQPAGQSVASQFAVSATVGQVVEALLLFFADGSVQGRASINGGADIIGTRSAGTTNPVFTMWNPLTMFFCQGSTPPPMALSRCLVGMGGGTVVNTIADARGIL